MTKKILLLIVSILLLLVSIGGIIYFMVSAGNSIPRNTTVITPEVVETYCDSQIKQNLSMPFIILFAASIMSLSTAAKMERYGDNFNKIMIIELVTVVIIGVFFLYTPVKKIMDIKNNDPRIETVQLTDKYTRRRRRSTNYYATFSNGATDRISSREYDAYQYGQEFYVIMCGDTCVDSFDAAYYELP
jgi:hypothetical protein